MKLENNNKRKTGKLTNTQKLNNSLLNNQQIKEEIKGGKSILRQMKMKIQHTKTYEIQQNKS